MAAQRVRNCEKMDLPVSLWSRTSTSSRHFPLFYFGNELGYTVDYSTFNKIKLK